MPRVQSKDSNQWLPLPLTVFHILLALVGKERHGYGIMKEVSHSTDNTLRLGPGTLYGAIKRLLQAGLIEQSSERPDPDQDDERRIYYRLTDFGQQVLGAETRRMSQLVGMAKARRVPIRQRLRLSY
jgi:DNA-binding PadR family transcriptional regulator